MSKRLARGKRPSCISLDFPKPTLISVHNWLNLLSNPAPSKGNAKEGLKRQGRMWTCLEIVLCGKSNLCYQLAVQFNSVRIQNTNQEQWQWHDPAETARLWHKSAGMTRTSQDTRRNSLLCLSQRSKDQLRECSRPRKNCKATYACPPFLS